MEDFTPSALQEIETIKQKLTAYREIVMTLKKGASTQDLQMIKNAFDELRLQMSQIEGLTEGMTVDSFSSRLTAINQAVEEVRREIELISNKLPTPKNTSEEKIINGKEEVQFNRFTSAINNVPISNHSSKQPSFIQLRNLANPVTQLAHKETIVPVTPIEEQENEKQKHHFNERYFQMIHTHPDNIYNGLYRNAASKTYFQFKNTKQHPYTLVNESNDTHPSVHSTSEIEKAELSASNEHKTESVNTHPPTPPPTESNNKDIIEPTINEITAMPNEETLTTPIISAVEGKKQRGSFLFNLFRK